MAGADVNLADRSGSLVESHKGYDPRIIFFYFVIAALLLVLVGGMAYQQLIRGDAHNEAERMQTQRRIVVPGPRGYIYDRNGKILVTNRPVFSVVLYVDELRPELRREQIRIKKNYREMDEKSMPSRWELEQIARVSVAQKYLDKVIRILGRDPSSPEAKIDSAKIKRHFSSTLVLPYTLLDDLEPPEYAKLLEELDPNSPLQVYTSSSRAYPYKALAAHALGYVRPSEDPDAEALPGDDLHTFKMRGTVGVGGLEKQFDDELQGTPGGSIFRVDPSGFRINPPLQQLKPQQGKSITTSLDVDLQQETEDLIGSQVGAAVAIDVKTGEVLVLASKPDYGDLNLFSPRASQEVVDKVNETEAWNNLATTGLYPPGSTFKTVVSVAGLRSGKLDPNDTSIDCEGAIYLGRSRKTCDNGLGHHGSLNLSEAIAVSCDIYFYRHGIDIGATTIAAEARRLHLDHATGIELPNEKKFSLIPDPQWKRKERDWEGPWTDGDTANMAIGQGYLLVTPLQMACWAASLARGETYTVPTLLHDPNRPAQHTEPLGLTPQQRAIIVDGMIGCTSPGAHHTAAPLSTVPLFRIPGVQIAGKTGTAQKLVTRSGKRGNINYAWFICFAPADKPEIAMAVMLEGQNIGETFAGGDEAGPIAAQVLKKYFAKKAALNTPVTSPFGKPPVALAR